MKWILFLIGTVTLLSTTGCIFADHRGHDEYREHRMEHDHEDMHGPENDDHDAHH